MLSLHIILFIENNFKKTMSIGSDYEKMFYFCSINEKESAVNLPNCVFAYVFDISVRMRLDVDDNP